jgi:hypothetical protein
MFHTFQTTVHCYTHLLLKWQNVQLVEVMLLASSRSWFSCTVFCAHLIAWRMFLLCHWVTVSMCLNKSKNNFCADIPSNWDCLDRFILGFFGLSVPWYVGAFIFLFQNHDYRERCGLKACTISAIVFLSVSSSVYILWSALHWTWGLVLAMYYLIIYLEIFNVPIYYCNMLKGR